MTAMDLGGIEFARGGRALAHHQILGRVIGADALIGAIALTGAAGC